MTGAERRPSGMSDGALLAILWFELALFGGLLVLMPAILFASALCDAAPACGPAAVMWGLVVPALAVGAGFVVVAVVLDLAARRWRAIAAIELLAGVCLIAVPVVAIVLTLRGEDAMVPLILSFMVLLVPGIGLLQAGSGAARPSEASEGSK